MARMRRLSHSIFKSFLHLHLHPASWPFTGSCNQCLESECLNLLNFVHCASFSRNLVLTNLLTAI